MTNSQPLQLRIQLLGGFTIRSGENTIPADRFRQRKARTLVKILALDPQHRLHRDQILELLWPDADPETAANSLYQAVYIARKVFAAYELPAQEILQFREEFLCLCPDIPLWVDVEAFEDAVSRARSSQDSAVYQAALELYPGTLLPEDLYEDWAVSRRETLYQEHLRLLIALARLEEQRQDYPAAIAAYQQVLAVSPAFEEAHAGLMRAYALSGQRSAALAQFEICRQALEKDLDVSPGPATIALYQEISAGTLASAPAPIVKPQPQPQPTRSSNLPIFLVPFVGRKSLLAAVREHLVDPACRLLTLTGPGGSGKTRLAVESVSSLDAEFPDGIFFVSLAGLQSSELVVPAIAHVLNFSFRPQGNSKQQLLDFLHEQQLLLVLDNFEHLLTGAPLVSEVLRSAPGLKILVTSRIGLNVQGETLLAIPGMGVPAGSSALPEKILQSSPVQLFIEGAQRVLPAYSPTPAELEEILTICRLLQGMPLAILLAAAWVRLLSPADITAQISSNSLEFLEGEWQDMPDRQRSMRAVFDYSWDLLSKREREVFVALSVFRGGFTYQAAQSITGVTLRELLQLLNSSFIERGGDSQNLGAQGRYELHELLRQYGEEKLFADHDRGEGARDRHAAWYAAALQRWAEKLKGSHQLETLAEIDLEIDNVSAAWNWAIERRLVSYLEMGMEGLGLFYRYRVRFSDGILVFQQAVDRFNVDIMAERVEYWAILASLLAWLDLLHMDGWLDESLGYERIDQSLELLAKAEQAGQGVHRQKAFSLFVMGIHLYHASYPVKARTVFHESLALYRDLDDAWAQAIILRSLARISFDLGDMAQAAQSARQSTAFFQNLGAQKDFNESRAELFRYLTGQGELEETDRLVRESNDLCRNSGDLPGLGAGLYALAGNLRYSGKYAEAIAPYEEAAEIWEKLGDQIFQSRVVMRMGLAKAGLGWFEQARDDLQKSANMFRVSDRPWARAHLHWFLGEVALAEGQWAEALRLMQISVSNVREGGHSGLTCWTLTMLGAAALKNGDIALARRSLAEALQDANEYREFTKPLYVLCGAALLAVESGRGERALELYALAVRYPFVANSAIFHNLVGKPIGDLAETLPLEVAAAARERGSGLDLWTVIEELGADPIFSEEPPR